MAEISSAALKQDLIELYRKLKNTKTLSPKSAQVKEYFSQLLHKTSFISPALTKAVLSFGEIKKIQPALQKLSAVGEYNLEKYWSQKIARSAHPDIEMENFLYYVNYEQLTNLEYQSLKILGERSIKRVLFVGSGPLPLTSILLAKHYMLEVDNLDKSQEAVALGQTLSAKLNLNQLLNFTQADIKKYKQLDKYDLVILASLVGLEKKEKQSIIRHIKEHMSPGALLLLRTASGLRTLVYPEIDPSGLTGLKLHATIQPLNEIVNSVIITEKPIQVDTKHFEILDKTSAKAIEDFKYFSLKIISEDYKYPYNPLWHFDIDRAEEIYGTTRSNLFVMYRGAEVVGTAAIRPYDRKYTPFAGRYHAKDTGSVWRFFIKRSYRGLGLEQLLHDRLEQFARKAKFKRLYAHDQKSVPGAVRKYVQRGYEVTHESGDEFGTVHLEKKL